MATCFPRIHEEARAPYLCYRPRYVLYVANDLFFCIAIFFASLCSFLMNIGFKITLILLFYQQHLVLNFFNSRTATLCNFFGLNVPEINSLSILQ